VYFRPIDISALDRALHLRASSIRRASRRQLRVLRHLARSRPVTRRARRPTRARRPRVDRERRGVKTRTFDLFARSSASHFFAARASDFAVNFRLKI
jgi:hypothetical protein